MQQVSSSRSLAAHQALALKSIEPVLKAHGIAVSFDLIEDDPPWLRAEFSSYERGPLEIQIHPRQVLMYGGPAIYEVYDRRCQYGEPSEIEEFARLLNRYLSGGEWYEYRGFFGWLRGKFSKK